MTKDIRRFTFRLPEDLFLEVERKAGELGVSINSLILQALWAWLEQNK